LPELQQLREECPGKIVVASADVTDYNAIAQAIDAFVQDKGKIDGSVHAAGILAFTPLRAFDEIQAKKMMDISFWAGLNLLQLSTNKKYAAKNTAHVQISSVNAHKGQKAVSAYSAAKAAVKGSIASIVRELSPRGHRINVISPGLINTEMTKDTNVGENVLHEYLLGIGTSEDVSGMVLFLLSNRARWITGADFVVDGGYLA
jgi:NAD(P)-dependent dehydrogenase (short-subunit alcohol dehydrogenase family)